ncbi:MAG: peptide transporter ATP-binding protein [Nocardioidaceae bacterium]|nr:peptide transporter ATP-binding protein [Nocardioidaceae bacterium]
MPRQPESTLDVAGLQVSVGDHLVAVRDVSFTIGRGESVGLVGESGSGKTLTCRAVLGLLPESGEVDAGRIELGSGETAVELTGARRSTWNQIRGKRLAAVFQDPASYLNPSLTIGHQVDEQLRVGGGLGRTAARERTLELLTEVGIHNAAAVYHQYPFQLSGGMLQRALIAIAVSLNPELLIADEATTALDTVVQAEILELLQRLRRTHQLSLLLVTHDLAVIAETCERVLVMYAGEIVESGPTEQVLGDPQHPYTQALMSVASIGDWSQRRLTTIPGQPPSAGEEMPGCRFAPRCQYAAEECVSGTIPLEALDSERSARCVRVAVPA